MSTTPATGPAPAPAIELTGATKRFRTPSGALHTADVDVVATLDVLEQIVGRFPHLATLDLDTLHEYQSTAHQAWAENFNAWRVEQGFDGPGASDVWPAREPVGTLW